MYLNTILILLFLHTFIYWATKGGRKTVLSCGLFGYIGEKNNHSFSWDKFNYLGRDNDERGGDSIGRIVGDDMVKFVNSKKHKTTYEDFVINYKNGEEHHMALGHTRKASIGGVSERTAQPIVLDIPTGEGLFAMVHNGTIHNWKELAVKYGVQSEGKSDSMVLAEIIMDNGYGVLKEYIGAAALIIRDDRTPDTLFIFKGESKNYSKATEERPLYFYQEDESSMYISSREEGLYFIGGSVDDVFDFDTNTLYEIYEGRIVSETIYDRSENFQSVPVATTTHVHSHSNFGGKNYKMYRDEWSSEGWNEAPVVESKNVNREVCVVPNPWSKIVVAKLRYWKYESNRFVKLNGIFHITEEGLLRNNPTYTKHERTRVYYFYNGVMLKDKQAYEDIKKIMPKAKHFKETWANTALLSKYSAHPVSTIEVNQEYQDIRWVTNSEPAMYTGSFIMLFDNHSYSVRNGDVDTRVVLEDCRIAIHRKSCDNPKPKEEPLVTAEAPMTIVRDDSEFENGPGENSSVDSDLATEGEVNANWHNFIDKIVDEASISQKDEDEDEEDYSILSEINICISTLLVAIDASRNEMEMLQVNSKKVKNIVENLNTLENMLQEDSIFKNKKIEFQYEK
jgi:predicted glutamine amidotransferase